MTKVNNSEQITLSPSSVNTWKKCPRLFYHRYILGKDIEPNIHLYRGSQVHSILEDIFDDTEYDEDLVDGTLSLFEAQWNPESELPDIDKEKSERFKQEGMRMLEFFLKNFQRQVEITSMAEDINNKDHAWNLLKPSLREHEIELEDENLMGIIDSVESDFDDRVFLIDYKTSKLYQNLVKEDHIRQVKIYAYLYYKDKGEKPDYVGVNYLKYGKTFLFNVDDDMLAEAVSDINEVRNSIQSTDIEDYPRGCDNPDYCDCRSFENGNTEM